MQILVSGANGFVGQAICMALSNAGKHGVRGALRRGTLDGITSVEIGDIGPETDWSVALQGVDVVVHLAARVHVLRETAADALAEFSKTNAAGTEKLAQTAARMGVRRFVYVSSVKVNGEETLGDPFVETDLPCPVDPYSISKYEAEQLLLQIGNETGMEIVILRPPLVYGPGVRANFLRLMNWAGRGIPLPLASVENRRSMIYLGNFVDALAVCASHPVAAGKTFLVSDGEDISTAQLIRNLARLMGKPAYLWPFPPALLRLFGRFVGRLDEVERLLGSLVIDSSKIRRELGWTPPFSMEQGLTETVRWFRMRSGRA